MLISDTTSLPQPTSRIWAYDGKGEPTISVVIALNDDIPNAAATLDAILAQTLPPDQVIVVDQGSLDRAQAIVSRYDNDTNITLLRGMDASEAAIRNYAMDHASGDLIAFVSHGEMWSPTHLAAMIAPLRYYRGQVLGLIAGSPACDEPGRMNPLDILADPSEQPVASLLFVRDAVLAIGGFDESLAGYVDEDLLIRFGRAGYEAATVKMPAFRRIESGTMRWVPSRSEGRLAFAQKLVRDYPGVFAGGHRAITDIVVPRLLRDAAEELRAAIRANDRVTADTCRDRMQELETIVPEPQRQRVVRHSPLVSVLIPSPEDPQPLARAINCVLAQIDPPDEIIVIEDGSAGHGQEAAQRFGGVIPIRVISQERPGPLAGLNEGIRAAYGDLIAVLKTDDRWYPNHIADLKHAMTTSQARFAACVFGDVNLIGSGGELIVRGEPERPRDGGTRVTLSACLHGEVASVMSASLFSRRTLVALGGFDETLGAYAGEDMVCRMLLGGYDTVKIDTTVSARYRDDTSVSTAGVRTVSVQSYVRKLIATLPAGDSERDNTFKQWVAPRFASAVVKEARQALAAGDDVTARQCVDELAFLDGFLDTAGGTCFARRPPLITVIIPLYNGGAYIEEAIRSVLNQTLPADEIIVIDDGSKDDGVEKVRRLAESHRIRLIQQPNGGQSVARNTGAAHAHGDLLAFLDQDDFWYPTHLARLVEPFLVDATRPVGWVYSDVDDVSEDGSIRCHGIIQTYQANVHPKRSLFAVLRTDLYMLPSASLVSRQAFLSLGGFDKRLSGYEDDDLFLRMFVAGFDGRYLPESLSAWRLYNGSSSWSTRMTTSRLIYAKLLIERFPNDPIHTMWYVRDIIGPRFLRLMLAHFRLCVLLQRHEQQKVALDHVRFIIRYVPIRTRLPMRYVVVPALRIPAVARFAAKNSSRLGPMVRWMV